MTPLAEGPVPAAGGAIWARVDGTEGAPWIVLSNSLGADHRMWDAQMPLLAPHFRVLRYDTRGHGRSATVPEPFGMDALVADLVAVMDAHGIDRADVMGLSLGGMTGMGLALAHPARVGRLIVADARADAPEGFRQNFAGRIARVQAGGLAGIVDGTLDSWFTADWRAANPDEVARVRAMILSHDPAGYIACCNALMTLDYLRHLGGIVAPTLYLGGDVDAGAAPEVMAAMAAATPGSSHVAIPSAAHVANINAPDAFDAAIRRFLKLPDAA
jgi:3-oxoadipate enol-lactonase